MSNVVVGESQGLYMLTIKNIILQILSSNLGELPRKFLFLSYYDK